jgi:hypothetical protein
MVWLGKADEQAQQDWDARSAKKRAELSISIEEALAKESLSGDLCVAESDEREEFDQIGSNSSVIIPPKLSLQSKPMPVVIVKPDPAMKAPPTDPSLEVSQAPQKKRRLAGRTTKVHLQAVPKSDKKSGGKISTETEKIVRSADEEAQSEVKNNAQRNSRPVNSKLDGELLNSTGGSFVVGSAVFRQGRSEVMIAHEHISPSSVVVVTLVGDPGPVVVKYISLQPQVGFTVHLSAQAEAETPFNYVMLPGEVS